MNTHADAKRKNLASQLLVVIKNGNFDRDALIQVFHLPRTTIFDALKILEKDHLIYRFNFVEEGRPRGRPRVYYHYLGGLGS